MAIAAEALAPEAEEGVAAAAPRRAAGDRGAWQGISRQSGRLRSAPGAVLGAVSTPSTAMETITKLMWAVALGLIVLEIAAQATGQQWAFSLGGFASQNKPHKGAYLPLYAGQQAQLQPLVFTGMQPAPQSSDTNLSGRAGGNLAV